MKIKVFEKCYTGTIGNMFPGQEYEVDDSIGQKLIDRNFAEPAKKTRKKKPANRAVKAEEISTPEDE